MDENASKRCARCGQEKSLNDFAKKRRNDHQPYCRPCQAEYHREHYRKNSAAYMAAAKRRLGRMRELLRIAKDKPCADCGLRYPYYVMDFDHRVAEEKQANITEFLYFSEEALRQEIDKCDVVCANRHRQRTFERKHWLTKRPKK
jgi:hypothetical protein